MRGSVVLPKSKGLMEQALADYRLALALDPASSLAIERLERLAAAR